jgi:hypothetical protein
VCDDLGWGALRIRGCEPLGREHERAHDGGAIVAKLVDEAALANESAKLDQLPRARAAFLHPDPRVDAGARSFSSPQRYR